MSTTAHEDQFNPEPVDAVIINPSVDDTDGLLVKLHYNLCIKGMPIPNEVGRSIINDLLGVLEEASLNRLCPILAEDAIKAAVNDYKANTGEDY